MRNVAGPSFAGCPGHALLHRVALALTVLMLGATHASAQLIFDGSVLYQNSATPSVAGQFVGGPTGGAAIAACPVGYNAAALGTLSFTHNTYQDPLLPLAAYAPNRVPVFQPKLGSPAYSFAVTVPNDGFFQQTCYVGAIGPDVADDWTKGWTYWDSTGASRQDLHLPGMPDPRPTVVHANIIANVDQFWGADSNHLVRGQFRVQGGASLTIAAGTVIFEERATLGTIRIDRGSKIFALGKADSVIIVTSDDAPGSQTVGAGGGLVINGRARVNNANTCAGDSASAEGGAVGFYGGDDDHDNSGALRYVRIEYAGKEITPNNELNSFTNNAVGDATTFDFLQAHRGADDGFETFGGTAQVKHLVCSDGRDDGFDWQQGYRGKAQFVIVRTSPEFAPSGTQNGDKGIEADNNDVAPFTQLVCAGRSNPIVANFTLVGDKRAGASFPGSPAGVNLRRATAGTCLNFIVYNYKSSAVKIDDDVTWLAHCPAIPPDQALFCSAATTGVVGQGQVFIANSAPNPFRRDVAFQFSLAEAGKVTVEVYGADGRLVETLVNRELPAGTHSIAWQPAARVPSGVYFYKVFANGRQASGKVIRVD
ncbi:MAG TPA: T9SS type A sorting domain-containing protein [Methylomirabilota bacterium]|nr:T9SS type A sorting domain-containing protein [Methylomirabilota bacterium]